MYHPWTGWSRRHAYANCTTGRDTQQPKASLYESRRHSRGSSFGVRRPLRYLAYHLDLSEDQMRRVAILLDRLKTEREQALLDESKTVTSAAELIVKDDVSMDELTRALDPRSEAAQRLALATARTLFEIRSILEPDQIKDFAYLLSNRSIVL
jgi:hypothetical protein